MISWDFGLINALKEKIDWEIYPSEPPEEVECPYLILEIGETKYRFDHTVLAEVDLRIIDSEKPSIRSYELFKKLQKISMEDLVLRSGGIEFGKAAMQIDRIVTVKNNQIIKLITIIKLKNMGEKC